MNKIGLIVAVALLLPAGNARAQATFTPLGTLPGETESFVNAISDSGTTIVGGTDFFIDNSGRAWKWTTAEGMVELPRRPEHTSADHYQAMGVSSDGSVIVGTGGLGYFSTGSRQGMRWSDPNAPPTPLGPSFASDVSSDGSVVSGFDLILPDSGPAWRWTSATGRILLTDPVPAPMNGCQCPVRALAISNDGSKVFGEYEGFPVSWTSTNPGVLLELGDGEFGAIHGVSGSGSTPVGVVVRSFPFSSYEAVAWMFGIPVSLFDGNGTTNFPFPQARGISASGGVVVGSSSILFGPEVAFVWTPHTGARDLVDLANAHGASLGTFALERAVAVANDGLTFVGTGRASVGAPAQAWLLTLPAEAFSPPTQSVDALPPASWAALGLLLGAALFHVERRRKSFPA